MIVYLDLIKANDYVEKYLRYENVRAVFFDIIDRKKWFRIVFDDGKQEEINESNVKSMEVR